MRTVPLSTQAGVLSIRATSSQNGPRCILEVGANPVRTAALSPADVEQLVEAQLEWMRTVDPGRAARFVF